MTADLYEKNNKYHVMLSWYQEGKRIQKSKSTGMSTAGNNKRKAEEKRKEILAEWEKKIASNYQDELFSDYMKKWVETQRRRIAETTYCTYKATVERQICPYFEERKIKLHELKPYHIQDFYAWKQDVDGVSGNTIHHYHANIHRALRDATRTERIKENPASVDRIALPRIEKFVADFYTAEEMRKLLEVVQGEKIEVPVVIASWFGLRRGEIIGLRWQDVDTKAMRLYVKGVMMDKGTRTRTENLKYRNGAKTASSTRDFPLPPEIAEYFTRVKAQQEKNKELFGDCYNTRWQDFICVDASGELIKPEYLSRAFPELLAKHGLRKIRLHELRDSNASLLLDNGADMKLIQLWMGHAHYSTTADIYAHHRADKIMGLGAILSKELAGENPTVTPEK